MFTEQPTSHHGLCIKGVESEIPPVRLRPPGWKEQKQKTAQGA